MLFSFNSESKLSYFKNLIVAAILFDFCFSLSKNHLSVVVIEFRLNITSHSSFKTRCSQKIFLGLLQMDEINYDGISSDLFPFSCHDRVLDLVLPCHDVDPSDFIA